MATKNIRLSAIAPILPPNTRHVSTTWEVSKIPRFDQEEYLVISEQKSTNYLLEYNGVVDIDPGQSLYFRSKFHYETTITNADGSTSIIHTESDWSRVISFNSELRAIKLSNTIINTPIIRYNLSFENDPEGELTITTSEMKLYGGIGSHYATTWEITDTDGVVVYYREKDVDNLTSITIPYSLLKDNRGYLIKAKHHTNSTDSNYGKTIFSTFGGRSSLFDVIPPDDSCGRMVNKWIYYKLELFCTDFEYVDLVIKNELGYVINRLDRQNTITPKINTNYLVPGNRYMVYARIKTKDGYTGYKLVDSFVAIKNTMIAYNPDIKYAKKYKYVQQLMLKGLTTQCSRELCNNVVILGKYNDNKLYSYRLYNGRLNEMSPVIELPFNSDTDTLGEVFVNVMPTYNGLLLIDYATNLIGSRYIRPEFRLYEYNPITNKATLISRIVREDEMYSTAVSNSAVITRGNRLYYVPAMITATGEILNNLELRVLNFAGPVPSIEKVCDLPFVAKQFVSLCAIDNDTIMIMGGSNTKTIANYDENWIRENNKIYFYKISTNTWTHVADVPYNYNIDIYNVHMFLRRDKKVVIFNNTDNYLVRANQSTLVFDPITREFTVDNNDHGDSATYKTSVYLNNGDILRISAREIDPQKVYSYLARPLKAEEEIDNTIIDSVEDLVVEPNTVMVIESPYRYKSITIKGTSYEDTGILKWREGDKVYIKRYRDLIITRPTILKQNLYIKAHDPYYMTWDSIEVLKDASLTIYNIVNVPDGVEFTLTAPVILDEINIGIGAKLIIVNENGEVIQEYTNPVYPPNP